MAISQELLASKLKDWTLSCKIQDILGLSDMEESVFKKELFAFEEKGVLEREGARRGLKFRFKSNPDNSEETTNNKLSEVEEAQISDIASYLQQKRHDVGYFEKQKSLKESLSFLIKTSPDSDPCINSYTLAIKHTPDGFVVRVYAGINKLSETIYPTKDKFLKFLKASGVSFDE